jgi:hypothetical protein
VIEQDEVHGDGDGRVDDDQAQLGKEEREKQK